MTEDFTVEFYESKSGQCPVRDFMDELKLENPDDHAAIVAGLAKLRNRAYHRPPLSKPLGGGLFELRHVGKLNTRVLYLFAVGKRIVALHGIRHKAQTIAKSDLDTARNRKADWMARNK